jgi:succinyl-CoA synthetase alpha subunit
MAVIIDENVECIVQGITGKSGSLHTKLMLNYGTKVVAGVTPGKSGEEVHGLKVYDTVEECVEDFPNIAVTSIWVPPRFAKDAALEAIEAGIKTVIVITEMIPIHDMLHVRKKAKEKGVMVLGGNTPGLISPGKAKVGMLPEIAFKPGRIGTIARSGSITYYLANALDIGGYGESTSIGIGGDPIIGANFEDVLKLFEKDDGTDAVVLAGEIGGVYEELAAKYIKGMSKPVIAYIAGRYAPKGKRMGHAGAIIQRGMGTAESKIRALRGGGAHIADTIGDIPRLIKENLN